MSDTLPQPLSTGQLDLSGRQLGDYQLLRRLGRGAMAEVYLAEQLSLRRQVAIKILKRELATDDTYVQRFHNEAMAAAALAHANIVQIHEVGQRDGIHFIAQEYVAGRNLGELVSRAGPPDPKLTLFIMRQCAAALCKAAEQGIVHRDIKPENIMLARTGEIKVADFGLARVQGSEGVNLTQVGVTMGTPLYMSPEQIEGKLLDARSDIYSLGVTCYHLLAGHPPFEGETALAVAVQHLNSPPERLEQARPDLPAELCRIVHKMLNKKPDRRYASPRELLQDLRALKIEGLEDDWADELEHWSAAEMTALSGSGRLEATERLGTLMQTSALLVPRPPKYRRLLVAALVCLLVGGAVASLRRPKLLLADNATEPIPKRPTAWRQLFHAKTAESELAWKSVGLYFPDEEFAKRLAQQGLVRHYLWQSEEYHKALPLLDELIAAAEGDSALRAFGLAGKCIALNLLSKPEEGVEPFARLTPEMIDQLDPAMRQALGDVVARNRAAMSRDAQRKLEQLRETPNGDELSPADPG